MRHALKELTIELKPSRLIPGEVGVFAARDIKAGEVVCEFADLEDDIITNEEFAQLSPALQEKIRAFTGGTDEGYQIVAGVDFNDMGITYFLNHSCEGNLGYNDDYNLIAIHDIPRGEELTYDYGLAEANPAYTLMCGCNTPSCRKIITGLDWQNPEFRAAKGAYLFPDMR